MIATQLTATAIEGGALRHRATIYSVRVHERYKPRIGIPFGDINGSGAYLGDFLHDVFRSPAFESVSADGQRDVRCSTSSLVEPEVRVMLAPGERGIRAEIMDHAGQLQFSQQPEHTHIVQCGSLFVLPRNETTGWWVTHVNNGRSVQSLVKTEIVRQFTETFDNYRLKIDPCVSREMLVEALNNDGLLSVSLFKHEQSSSDVADRGKWARDRAGIKLELGIKAEKGDKLRPNLVKRFLAGEEGSFGQIIEFEGMAFDSAKCQVELPNGDRRTFNIETPDSGHPISQDIYPKENDGDLVPDSLFGELRRVIEEV